MANYKLGKLAPKFNAKTLLLPKYLSATALPPVPEKRAWEYKISDDSWGMFANDTVGDCTCAGIAHILMVVTANAGKVIVPTNEQVLGLYSAVTGYDPSQTDAQGNNPTDNGAAMTDVLAYVLKNGFAGRKILGWVQINHTNLAHVDQSIDLFGACYGGVLFPDSAMDQFNAGKPWNLTNPPDSADDGHCIPWFGFGGLGKTCVSWARRVPCGTSWISHYMDEGYGVIFDDWFDTKEVAPNQIDRDQLWLDLKALAA